MKVLELHRTVTDSNDRDAARLRTELTEKKVFLINLMSSAGSGKTTFLLRTLNDLREKLKIAVLEADIEASVDAESIANAGAQSVQVHTDGMCHMDAGMTRQGLEAMDLEDTDLVFLENIGNLICPAEYDTGAHSSVMILSVPEGDDKPLKYPLMFSSSEVLIVSKMDTINYFDFDLDKLCERVRFLNKDIKIFPVSAVTGEGMEAWENWLLSRVKTGE